MARPRDWEREEERAHRLGAEERYVEHPYPGDVESTGDMVDQGPESADADPYRRAYERRGRFNRARRSADRYRSRTWLAPRRPQGEPDPGDVEPELPRWPGDFRRTQQDQVRGAFSGLGPKGYRRADERIREDVCDRLTEADVDCSEVEVAVDGGEVRLEGSVQTREQKRWIEEICDDVPGVHDVQNRLRIAQRGAPPGS